MKIILYFLFAISVHAAYSQNSTPSIVFNEDIRFYNSYANNYQ